ncbi:RES family NAD+ phosphorylase [Spirosoma spitsbergense]|uniref:RES family NAD+ phosphorylase n=1 Tax=Spirosoma spitsbergense TaxID=431554 RepID=UPI000366970A|nr:RES family NAD+ phosphorylase [Spirosoma spitsbergense]
MGTHCWLSTIQLPDEPETIFWIAPNQLPSYWKSGTLAETQTTLADWLVAPFCLAVAVPSVIMNESFNLLLHPEHPAFAQVRVIIQRSVRLDNRLRP